MRRTPLSLIAALALTACAVEEPPPEPGTWFLPPPGGYPAPSAENCPNYGCGKNTAAVGPTEFHELHHAVERGVLVGRRNSDGVRIVAVHDSGGRPMRLEVNNTTLRGIHLQAPYGTISGNALVGTRIELQDRSDGGHIYVLTLEGVGTIETWVEPIVEIEKYYFTVLDEDGLIRPLCKAADLWAAGDALDDGTWGTHPEDLYDAILFSGDRYDRLTKTVVATGRPTTGWFNIGCAGTALPKLVLNRLTNATDDAAHQSSPSQRQAALRAITATYCPDSGVSYTYDGVDLLYTNAPDWMDIDYTAIGTVEAVWSADGPVCLTEPRLADEYPGLIDTIDADCGLPPPCSQVALPWSNAGYFFTATP